MLRVGALAQIILDHWQGDSIDKQSVVTCALYHAIAKPVNNLEWIYTPRLLQENDIPALLLNYCDMRMGTKGILPIQERFADLKSRAPFAGIDEIAALSPKLESTIQVFTTINLNDITYDQLDAQIQKLLAE